MISLSPSRAAVKKERNEFIGKSNKSRKLNGWQTAASRFALGAV
jgi:hypothetical protein